MELVPFEFVPWIIGGLFALAALDIVLQRFANSFDTAARRALDIERSRNDRMHQRLIQLEATATIAHREHRIWRERNLGPLHEPLELEQQFASLQAKIVRARIDDPNTSE
jgi:hypothetical protein